MIPVSIAPLLSRMRLTLNQIEGPCLSHLVSPPLPIRRPQKYAGSASEGGSCLVSSSPCPPGSEESASVKALKGDPYLVSPVDPMSLTRLSSSRAIVSHRDSALENTPDSSHTRPVEQEAYEPSYRNLLGRPSVFPPLGGPE